jgi:hypothetical protein
MNRSATHMPFHRYIRIKCYAMLGCSLMIQFSLVVPELDARGARKDGRVVVHAVVSMQLTI